jgi:acyl-CoA synthetase (AMP-forming)/AMP-acid ligase II/acyl carrier protein
MLDSVHEFLQKLRDFQLTVLSLPTAYWHELIESLGTAGLEFPESLRLVIIGGERADPSRLATWQKHVGNRLRLLNTYGPTEATVVATLCDLSELAEADIAWRKVPIGRPIRNVQIYILDGHLQPVPIGVPGELHIGGMGLARGYLNHPELTVERFIPNPFSDEPGARLYQTGDLARYLPDGVIEFLGRRDHQVKIRGFRVELSEIEAVLAQHPSVQQTVVLAREEKPGEKRLVAYIVPASTQKATPGELRRFLKEKLPDYMVPAAFVILDALPLTPNGKVDRRALPAPEGHRPQLGADDVMPQTDAERRIAAVWQEMLQVEKVGIHDNFFDLGGHSLLLIQIQSQLQNLFGQELSIAEMFQHPTIHALTKYLSQEQSEPLTSAQSPDRAQMRRGRLASIGQQRQLRQKHRSTNQPGGGSDE